MKKLFIILYLLTNIFVLGACGDVESEGDPQPRVPRVLLRLYAYRHT